MGLSLGGLGSVLGAFSGGLNYASSVNATHAQNRYNLQEADKARKWNDEQAQKNRDWQESMYQKYNTIQAQMAQYQAAGLNPYVQSIQGQAFSGSGAQATTEPTQLNAIDESQEMALASGINGAMNGAVTGVNMQNQIANTSKVTAETQGQEIQNNFDLKSLADRVNGVKYSTEEQKHLAGQAKLTWQYMRDTLQSRINMQYNSTLMSDYQNQIAYWQAKDARWQAYSTMYDYLNIKPLQQEQLRKSIDLCAADIAYRAKQGMLTLQQIQSEIAHAAQGWSQVAIMSYDAHTRREEMLNTGKDLKNQQWNRNQATYRANRLQPFVKDELRYKVNRLTYDLKQDKKWQDIERGSKVAESVTTSLDKATDIPGKFMPAAAATKFGVRSLKNVAKWSKSKHHSSNPSVPPYLRR